MMHGESWSAAAPLRNRPRVGQQVRLLFESVSQRIGAIQSTTVRGTTDCTPSQPAAPCRGRVTTRFATKSADPYSGPSNLKLNAGTATPMGFLRVLGAFGPHSKDLMRYGKGFDVQTAKVDQFQWSYMNRPAANSKSREIVVFLHGLGSSKEAWVRVASGLSKNYHVVIPDLPGHGKTTPHDPNMNFTADRQARRLHEFFESELYPNNKVHLVGTCMGATVAGMYAAMHPTRVKSLTLLCPWGISMPTMSVTLSDIDDLGKVTLQSPTETSTSEIGEWRDRGASSANFEHTPKVFRALAISKRGRARGVLQKVLVDMLAHPTILEDELHNIRARTMVVWGDQDEVLDVSCLKVIDDKLNVTRKHVVVLEKCGHLVPTDKPIECVDVLNKFLADEELSFTFSLAEQQSVMAF